MYAFEKQDNNFIYII